MDGIVASRPGTRGCAALPVEQGSHPQPHSARNRKRGHKGPFFNFWRRGQSARIARTCGPGDRGLTFSALDGIVAARPGMRLRRCARRTGFSSATALGEKNKKGHEGPFCFSGGEGGIRTPGTVSPYTRFPGEHLKPLSHLSVLLLRRRYARRQVQARRSFRPLRPRVGLRHRHFPVRLRCIQVPWSL